MTDDRYTRVDTAALHTALDEQRLSRGMTWPQVAQEVGRGVVSAASLTELARGGRTGVHTFMAILHWLGLPAESFLLRPGSTRHAVVAPTRWPPALRHRARASAYEQGQGLAAARGLRDSASSPLDLMAQISNLLRAQTDLSPEKAAELEGIIGLAYARLRTAGR